MGVGGIGIWQLLIVLVIILLLFGTKKLRNLGSDLGGALKGFKNAMGEEENKDADNDQPKGQISQEKSSETIDVKAEKVGESEEEKS